MIKIGTYILSYQTAGSYKPAKHTFSYRKQLQQSSKWWQYNHNLNFEARR